MYQTQKINKLRSALGTAQLGRETSLPLFCRVINVKMKYKALLPRRDKKVITELRFEE